jgi:uncharacterized protein
MLFQRRAEAVARESLASFRVVVLHGARQAGKTTIARRLAAELGGEFVTLDRGEDRNAAMADPETFIAQLARPAVIDEIQRAGDPLVLAIKLAVDEHPRPGEFLLTGSTNFLTVPSLSETLAGRVDLVTLWPLSQAEILSTPGDLIERVFDGPTSLASERSATLARDDYLELVCRGGYPEALGFSAAARRRWFARYAQTVVEREIEVAADLRRADLLISMLRLFAARTGQEYVTSSLARTLGADRTTIESYRAWLQTAFLIDLVPAWSRNLAAKFVRRPKLHVVDSGLAAATAGKDVQALRRPTEPMTGPLLETFVAGELRKQLGRTTRPARLFHYREPDGIEIDLVLESDDGRICGIEVKASTAARPADARGLERLRDRLDQVGDDFRCGIVLHTGKRRFSLGDRIVALPIADVWS